MPYVSWLCPCFQQNIPIIMTMTTVIITITLSCLQRITKGETLTTLPSSCQISLCFLAEIQCFYSIMCFWLLSSHTFLVTVMQEIMGFDDLKLKLASNSFWIQSPSFLFVVRQSAWIITNFSLLSSVRRGACRPW